MNHKIPKVIHQIWIGDRDMPDHCRRYVDKMKLLHQDWSVKLWGNEVFDLYSDDEFLNHWMTHPDPGGHLKWAYISDRIRLLLLRDFGGIYVDVDAQIATFCLPSNHRPKPCHVKIHDYVEWLHHLLYKTKTEGNIHLHHGNKTIFSLTMLTRVLLSLNSIR